MCMLFLYSLVFYVIPFIIHLFVDTGFSSNLVGAVISELLDWKILLNKFRKFLTELWHLSASTKLFLLGNLSNY